ncbi:MAG TPA: polyphosphate kinase 2 family protein, partial [Candidatus Krumholzibacteria bacterium]|nr:polyphosphate kinase 2 family protein [Candidatus Krumholzibacteria bacterium]
MALRYRVKKGSGFRLADHDPADTGSIHDKAVAERLLRRGVERLRDAQERLYAQDAWSVLVILQAMDAAGKDGVIEHVMAGVNPQGCEVSSFKAPSEEELDHDYLWRTTKRLPERGRIGIFNRSYYEEVLVVKVHPAFLDAQRLPPG